MKLVCYSGAGNTFFLADNRRATFDLTQIPALCKQGSVDGVILAEEAQGADARMRIYNSDGGEAEMCGNGLRCFIHFLQEIGVKRSIYQVETLAGKHSGWFVDNEVCVQLPPPSQVRLHLSNNLHFINTGVPHAVVFVPDVKNIEVASQGKALRHSSLFAPAGANVNFVSLQQDETLNIRTYERGVEAETQACGTGATAAALIAHKLYQLESPIEVKVRSQEKLKISFAKDFSEVTLQGPFEIKGACSIMIGI